MNNTPKSFVFIPGAWMGDWAWHEVMQKLESNGHHAYSLTLSGVTKNADPADITLQTHVDDVLKLIRNNTLQDVVLVGHSYSGLVAGIVASQDPERIKHVVFVKAFLPHDGRSLLDAFPEEQANSERDEITSQNGKWLPPSPENIMNDESLDDKQKRWLIDHMVAHPGQTVIEPVVLNRPLSELSATFIDCNLEGHSSAEMQATCKSFNWIYHVLTSGHWPMITVPDALAKRLMEVNAVATSRFETVKE